MPIVLCPRDLSKSSDQTKKCKTHILEDYQRLVHFSVTNNSQSLMFFLNHQMRKHGGTNIYHKRNVLDIGFNFASI